VQSFVNDKKLVYFETSAKTGHNVKDMFIQVATQLAERNPQTQGGPNSRTNKGTTLEQNREEQKGNDWRNCGC